MRAVNLAWAFLAVRVLWDVWGLWFQKIIHRGDVISYFEFLMRPDGYLLVIPLFFGTLLPAVLMYFVKETLKVKSTQSATGILYCVVTAVLMGDLTYRYFQLKFAIHL